MASTQCLLMYVVATVLILLTSLPAEFVASVVFEAGNSSFTPLQESSFWTSDGGNYTFGFQAVNGGDDYLLSIWRSGDPNKTAIWWPLGSNYVDYDPTVKADAIFHFTSNGSLQLHRPNRSLSWSTNTASSYAELQDSGNLVLFDNVSSAKPWQSFEDSRNSLMLAGVSFINVANKSHLLQSKRNQSSYSTGRFRFRTDADENLELHGIDRLGNDFIYVHGNMYTSTAGDFWVRKDNTIYNDNAFTELKRLTLDYDGNLRIYEWESNRSSWSAVWQIVYDQCLVGSLCGPFGVCETVDADGKANCSCPPGYQARVFEDPSQGCESSISFNASCGSLPAETEYTTTMVEVPNMDYHYNDLERLTGVDIETCKQRCLNRCADCMASEYKEISGHCYIKGDISTGYLMNGYLASDSTLLIKVVKLVEPKKDRRLVMRVGVAAAVLVVGCGGAFLLWRRRDDAKHLIALLRPRRGQHYIPGDVGRLRFYRHDELAVATRNFSEKLGEGGFATVFKGWVKIENKGFENTSTEVEIGSNRNDNPQQLRLAVAVKVLKSPGDEKVEDALSKSYSQFKSEISTLGKIHHVNLVSLLGYSYSSTGVLNHRKVLVYECMDKGSLDRYLSTTQSTELKLPWATRYSIALGTARGIAYLHHDCNPPILHCDIKPHNILLDAHFTAKVADFGFARHFHLQRNNSHIIMSAVRGTRGYLAPEWLRSDEITFKADVYSFGMVLLELVRGFRTHDELHMSLIEWGIQCISEGAVTENSPQLDGNVGDIHMDDAPSAHQDHENNQDGPQEANEKLRLLKVGMWCIQHKPTMRPSMFQVLQLIEGTITMEDPPTPSIPPVFPSFLSSTSSTTHYTYSSFSPR